MADPIYRIHPAIGIARVGNADRATFFIGPEFPNFGPAGPPSLALFNYKSGGLIRPQAARFRVYEYLTNKKGDFTLPARSTSAIRIAKASPGRFTSPTARLAFSSSNT